MTSSNINIFRVTGLLCGKFTSHLWIPLTKASDAELWCFLWWESNEISPGLVWFNSMRWFIPYLFSLFSWAQILNLAKILKLLSKNALGNIWFNRKFDKQTLVQVKRWHKESTVLNEIFKTIIFSNVFSGMKMHGFRLRFHWSLFLRFQSTIFQNWFR